MLFWLLFAIMTGAAVFAVLWPLARAAPRMAARGAADLAVYRDQLAEIERDRARGLLAGREAEVARVEVSRRLLAAADAAEHDAPATAVIGRRRVTAALAIGGIPALAIALYLALGSPELPDAPLSARLARPPEHQEIAIMVRRIEAHLAANPNDGRGWELLAPIYLRLGRTAEAVKARTNAHLYLGPSAQREADLGEALVADANGIVTWEARAAFDRAMLHDQRNTKALFFLGLAAEQDGRQSEALSIWGYLKATAMPDDPWWIAAQRRLDRRGGGAVEQLGGK